MKLYFSIDLESWAYPHDPRFHGLDSSARKKIDGGYVLESINEILNLLAKYNQKVTFFAIAEIFEWYPDMFRIVKKAGHEIGYHTHRHTRIVSADVMKMEISASREFLKEFKPIGFRAPEIYFPGEAIKPLADSGFRYSSSVYGSYLDVFKRKEKDFFEFPVSSFLYMPNRPRIVNYPTPLKITMLAKEMPFGAGYFFALLPRVAIERMIQRYFKAGKSVFMFAHNWQIIQPKNASFPDFRYKLTHPLYLPYTVPIAKKVEYFLKKYTLGRMDELVWSQKNIGIKK